MEFDENLKQYSTAELTMGISVHIMEYLHDLETVKGCSREISLAGITAAAALKILEAYPSENDKRTKLLEAYVEGVKRIISELAE